MVSDPVCGMKLEPQQAAARVEREGTTYYFCSEGCREEFLRSRPADRPHRHYELIIIGGGPAGLTAAVHASLLMIDTLLVARDLGGQAVDSRKIRNYMGYDFITGPELIGKFQDQLLRSHYVDHRIENVEAVDTGDGGFRVTLADRTRYLADSLIIATGMSRRALSIPGEEEFQRKGVFYGNAQDFSFVSGKDVAVVGGGNSALHIVENLHTIARLIYLLSDYDLSADPAHVELARRYRNLQIRENVTVLRFTGGESLGGVVFRPKASAEEERLPVSAAFVSIGQRPNADLVAGLVELNGRQEIVIGPDCSTSKRGIFAAGDATDAFGKRILIAAAEGTKAALAARQYILDRRAQAAASPRL
jgi:alkyl hydroperoxide reductase subunit F